MNGSARKALTAAAVLATLSSSVWMAVPSAFAATTGSNASKSAQGTLVSLGDSITFGYNLSDTENNTVPSASAFPFQIGKADNLQVTDLGVPGWTSSDLLNALSSPNFARSVKQANLISIDIGNNDLLRLAGPILAEAAANPTAPIQLTDAQKQQFAAAIQTSGENLTKIIALVRQLSAAPILLYNLYNPFPQGTGVHDVTEQLESPLNQIITQVAASNKNVVVVDAHTTFEGKQTTLVRVPGDVHPTVAGQTALATIGETALQPLLPSVEASAAKTHGTVTSLAAGSVADSGGSVVGHLNGSTITAVVPSGNEGTEVDLTSQAAADVSSLAPSQMKVAAEFGVNYYSDAQFSGPVQFTVGNTAIPANGAVYQVVGGKLSLVADAKVTAGKAVFTSKNAGDFVVLAPVSPVVTGATKPVTGIPARAEGIASGLLILLGAGAMFVSRKRRGANV